MKDCPLGRDKGSTDPPQDRAGQDKTSHRPFCENIFLKRQKTAHRQWRSIDRSETPRPEEKEKMLHGEEDTPKELQALKRQSQSRGKME